MNLSNSLHIVISTLHTNKSIYFIRKIVKKYINVNFYDKQICKHIKIQVWMIKSLQDETVNIVYMSKFAIDLSLFASIGNLKE